MNTLENNDLFTIAGGRNSNGNNGQPNGNGYGLSNACTGVSAVAGVAAGGLAVAGGVTAPAAGLIGVATATATNTVCNTVAAIATQNPSVNESGGSSGGKVICTELCRNGVIEHDVWMADLAYSRKHFSEQTMRGYHAWGVPYVKLMRKSPLFAKLAEYPTQAFAQDIAYRMGVVAKPNYMGWALRELAFRPVCWSIGVFAKARDFQHLWTGKMAMA
jgi:hypothetical protein